VIFVGRETEIAAVEASLDAGDARARVLLVSGEPGIGKTRLAEEVSRRAAARGFAPLWGRAWEGDGTPAYYPWIQALRALPRRLLPAIDAARREHPELAIVLGGGARAAGVDPDEARFRLHDELAALLHALSQEVPLLVVLDDLHACDLATLGLVEFLARSRADGARLRLLLTTRDVAFSVRPDAAAVLARIAREAIAVPLGRLGRDHVSAWVAGAAPDLASSVDRLVAISEGNPLFLGELIAASRKRPGRGFGSALEMPIGIREAIRAHVALLSETTQRSLETASVLGRELPIAALPAEAVEEATLAGILHDAGEGRLRFTHVLIRDELHAALPPERRRELHRAAALREVDPVLAAPHWIMGARPEDATEVAAIVEAAIDGANARLAFEDAAALGQRAVDVLGPLLPPRRACALLLATSAAWTLAGRPQEARRAGARAFELASAVEDAELLARAAIAHAIDLTAGDRDVEALRLLRAALERLPADETPLRAHLLARHAVALFPAPPDEHGPALAAVAEAVALARRLGDEPTLFEVLRLTRALPGSNEDVATRLALNGETIALARKLGRVPLVASLLAWQVATYLELGDPDGAAREASTMESLLEVYRQPAYRFRPLLVRAMLADLEGRFAEADALSRRALSICDEHGVVPGLMLFAVQRGAFLYSRGDADGWDEHEELANRVLGDTGLAVLFRSISDAMTGREERARAALSTTRHIPLHTLPDGPALAFACAAAGAVDEAERFHDLVRDAEGRGTLQFGPGRVALLGPFALVRGRLAVLLGRAEEALGHFARARELAVRLRAGPYLAQIDLAVAEVLARSEPVTARERAERAHDLAAHLGMRAVRDRARALAGGLAAPPPPGPRPPRADVVSVTRSGETWTLRAPGSSALVLRDSKGLAYLEALVRSPGREIHVLELAGVVADGDAGPLLDDKAKRAYRERADALREELEEATVGCDPGRADRARAELDALASELARAVGLGGRDRRAASAVERARINVQRRLRDVIGRVRAEDDVVGEHLDVSVRTGLFCVYLPAWPRGVTGRDRA
jgi:tetratricopeptide (TPR) repeat protein